MNLGIKNQNSPTFSARLSIKAAENMIAPTEMERLFEQAKQIGSSEDVIHINIGQSHNFQEGIHDLYNMQSYDMTMSAIINGELQSKNLSQRDPISVIFSPFKVLTDYFDRLKKFVENKDLEILESQQVYD